jgi:DNA mismatch repair ATPase MutL
MYTNLHAVISELIANSWDADANNIHITIPVGKIAKGFEITVKDDGNGMNFDDLNNMIFKLDVTKEEKIMNSQLRLEEPFLEEKV